MNRRSFVSKFLGGLGAATAFSGLGSSVAFSNEQGASPQAKQKKKVYRKIATEEAFTIPEQAEILKGISKSNWGSLDLSLYRVVSNPKMKIHDKLLDIGADRIRDMDENKVDMQVLSLTAPGVQIFDGATAMSVAALVNDRLADAVKARPSRFAGLAAVAPQDPAGAAVEMERAINKLNLNGFIINSHTNGEYLDDKKFWPIFEAAEALERPIYLHPRSPSDIMGQPYADYTLAYALWGFQAETGLHAMRLMMSGVFDRFPKLKIVLGHMGESIPYNLWRSDYMYKRLKPAGQIPSDMTPGEIFKRNFMITTSGVEHLPVLKYCIEVLGADNIMWAIDYPYQSSAPAVDFMENADISEDDKEKIFHGNAERVFRIAAG